MARPSPEQLEAFLARQEARLASGILGAHGTRPAAPACQVLGLLGRHGESAPIRQALFEQTLGVFDLHRWLEHLPESSRPETLARARQLALNHHTLPRRRPCCWTSATMRPPTPCWQANRLASMAAATSRLYRWHRPCRRAADRAAKTAVYRALLLWQVLTAKRWELLKIMCGAGSLSIRQAARRVDRDVTAVHGDVGAGIKT
jgi:hypothetical protein